MNINDFPNKIIGDYVISPCLNAFPGSSKVSYWISKKGYVYAAYAFSANSPKVAEEMLRDEYYSDYVNFFESLLEDRAFDSKADEGKVTLKSYVGGKISETIVVDLNTAACAFHAKQCEIASNNNNISFTSINVDGQKRYWKFHNVSEIEERMVSEDYDLPAYDDAILDVHVYSHEPVLITFEDLLRYLDILADLED